MKTFVALLIICAAALLGSFRTAQAYPKPVAVITNYEAVAGGIAIQRSNGASGGSEALLYSGDAITGNVGYVR